MKSEKRAKPAEWRVVSWTIQQPGGPVWADKVASINEAKRELGRAPEGYHSYANLEYAGNRPSMLGTVMNNVRCDITPEAGQR